MARSVSFKAGALIALALVGLGACSPSTAKDEAAITGLMRQTWDRPDSRLQAGPVVVDGASAIADWTQGQMGGRALLERRKGRWVVVLCAGDMIRSEAGLAQVGLPTSKARTLAAKLARAEAAVSPDRLAIMTRFQGIVPMSDEASK